MGYRLAIDIGNTAVKWATFEGRTLLEHGTFGNDGAASAAAAGAWAEAERTMVCASGDPTPVLQQLSALHLPLSTLTSSTPLPIRLDYKTPATLGPDRIAAACGAWSLHPGENTLVVDCGTCITLEYVSADGTYHGGAIMPGLGMKLQALHTFTAKLPLLDIASVQKAPVLGRSTEECMAAGTLGATQMAVAAYVATLKGVAHDLRVVLTGGDAERIAPPGTEGREHQPQLTLIGLNEIMIHNEK